MEYKKHLEKYLTSAEIDKLSASQNLPYWNGVFLNPDKISSVSFKAHFPNVKEHPLISNAFIFLKEDYPLGKHLLHELGAYYIQEPSAMMVAHLLAPQEDDVILDLCASPGGKSLAASILMNNKGLIISNDLSYSRAEVLSQNVERLGRANIIVTSFDIEKNTRGLFNLFTKIILDAPCSGSSMFRKEPKMMLDWTYEKVLRCAKIQKTLLKRAFDLLKYGGELIYSTCSFSFEENEEVIAGFLRETPTASLIDLPHIDGEYRPDTLPETIRFFPHIALGEGHFIAKIKKDGLINKEVKLLREDITPEFKEIRQRFALSDLTLTKVNNCIYGVTSHIGHLGVPTLRYGVKIAEVRKGNLLYDHALSHYLDNGNSLSLNKAELDKFLSGESFPTAAEDGYHVVAYSGVNIGLGKATQGILKNHYPKGLRRLRKESDF